MLYHHDINSFVQKNNVTHCFQQPKNLGGLTIVFILIRSNESVTRMSSVHVSRITDVKRTVSTKITQDPLPDLSNTVSSLCDPKYI